MGWRRSILEHFIKACSLFVPRARTVPADPAKILVLRNNDIGDLLVVTPLFEALNRTFPNAEIIAGIGSWNIEVLLGNPYVDRIVTINAPWHNHFVHPQTVLGALRFVFFSSEMTTLRGLRADVGIDVLGSGFGSLVLICARVPYRLGVRGYAGGESAVQAAVDYRPDIHVGRQALRFAEILGCSDLPENRPQIFLEKPIQSHGAIVIAPGAGLPEKGWPEAHFIQLARLLKGFKVTVIGSGRDSRLASRMREKNTDIVDLTGKLSLRECFAVVAGGRLLVSNASMAMHAAAAFCRPAVILLGQQFTSAAAHHRQWGYPEAIHLGREKDHPGICCPDEAMGEIQRVLSRF
jgi:ADP-heptose:LPS heptosyltransferase